MKGVVWLWVLAIWAVAFGGLGRWVAVQKRRDPTEGTMLGILFGPLGVIVEGLLPVGEPESQGADIEDEGIVEDQGEDILEAMRRAKTKRRGPHPLD